MVWRLLFQNNLRRRPDSSPAPPAEPKTTKRDEPPEKR
jgi:hypothetical protein